MGKHHYGKDGKLNNMEAQKAFNLVIERFFTDAIRIFAKRPSLLLKAAKIANSQRKALKVRQRYLEEKINVPPMMIFSITNRCNLKCKGCYHHAQKREGDNLGTEEITRIFKEARELGISLALIAGGEPFSREDLLPVLTQFPEILYAVFTNGTLLDADTVCQIKKTRNIIPILSIEGDECQTDKRRGKKIFSRLSEVMADLKIQSVPYGLSITVTNENFEKISSLDFVKRYVELGAVVFFFVEYVPFEKGSESLLIDQKQRELLKENIEILRKKMPALFVSFPGDEDQFGGCLAAGRGFIHINASGGVEPCPFSPYSDVSLKVKSLKEALDSRLLAQIRQRPVHLRETSGGCALFSQKEEISRLLGKK